MKYLASAVSLLALGATGAIAGGVDRSGQSVAVIFEEGTYAELSFGAVSADVSGTAIAALGGFDSGDMSERYFQFGAAIKHAYGNGIDVALIIDQPFGADVDYPAGTGYYAQGATAELNSTAVTGVVSYTLPSNFSFHGGIRYQTLEAEANVPFVAGYDAQGDRDGAFGYLLGVAYERPDIALRVALTYNSSIEHELDTTETSLAPGAAGSSTTPIDTPESLNLEFQTGVAADTLVFGSVRYVKWSDFEISPIVYQTLTGGGSLVSFDDDTITYTLGVGRKFNENWSGAISVSHEPQTGGFSSNLGPTDGATSVGLGATYTMGKMEITGGIRYVWVGDTQTTLGAIAPSADFEDNDAIGVGITIGYTF